MEKVYFDANKIYEQIHTCSVEGCTAKGNYNINGKHYCYKHHYHIIKFGSIKRTIYDKNEIIKHEDYAEIIVRDKNNKIKGKTIIDLDDVERCSKFKCGMYSNGYFYLNISKTKRYRLHRFIMNIFSSGKDIVVDHIDRNPANNRKSNLRICDITENNNNVSYIYTNRKCKYRNVKYDKVKEKYYSSFYYRRKRYFCGYHNSEEDAYKAYINKHNIVIKGINIKPII